MQGDNNNINEMIERIGVFCSANESLPDNVVKATEQLGEWIGRERKMLVYGGVSTGLMEVLAIAVKKNGGRTMGVVPDKFLQQGKASGQLDIEMPVVDLSDRKSVMMREADIFVALPGGIGTLDEMFTVMAASKVGEHRKQVILFNPDGFWNGLLEVLRKMEEQGYIARGFSAHIAAPATMADVIALLAG